MSVKTTFQLITRMLFFLYFSFWSMICLGLFIGDFLKPNSMKGAPILVKIVFNYVAPFVSGIIFGAAAITIFFERKSAPKWKNSACIVNLVISLTVPLFYYHQGMHDFLQAELCFALPVIIGIVGLLGRAGLTIQSSERESATPPLTRL